MTLITIDTQTGNAVVNNVFGVTEEYALSPATAGFRPSGPFVIHGFQAGASGDLLDLSSFIRSVAPGFSLSDTDPFLGPYLRLTQSGADTIVQMDPSGSGAWTDLVTLKGVDGFSLTWFNFDIRPTRFDTSANYAIILPSVSGVSATIFKGDAFAANGALQGTGGPDILVGGRNNDVFHGGAGSDRIFDGTGGFDTATYDGAYRSYKVTGAYGYLQVSGGPEGGTDTLVFIARAQFVDGYITTNVLDTAAEVYRTYEATLGRAPDAEGLTNWTRALNNSHDLQDLQAVVNGFVGSAEFQQTYGNLDNNAFVSLLYRNVLHRDADPGGLSNWVGQLNAGHTRAQVVTGFSESSENITALAGPVQQGLWVADAAAGRVARLYDTVFGRLPDSSGLANWVHALKGGASLQTVANGFVASTEFQTTYGALDNNGFVTLLYHNVLGRLPDPDGLSSWVGQLNGGHSRAEVVVGFSESAEHVSNTAAHVDYGVWVAS